MYSYNVSLLCCNNTVSAEHDFKMKKKENQNSNKKKSLLCFFHLLCSQAPRSQLVSIKGKLKQQH